MTIRGRLKALLAGRILSSGADNEEEEEAAAVRRARRLMKTAADRLSSRVELLRFKKPAAWVSPDFMPLLRSYYLQSFMLRKDDGTFLSNLQRKLKERKEASGASMGRLDCEQVEMAKARIGAVLQVQKRSSTPSIVEGCLDRALKVYVQQCKWRRKQGIPWALWQYEDEDAWRLMQEKALCGVEVGISLLPEDLLQESILALLPLHQIFQMRVVCKSWNWCLRSPALVEHCLQEISGGWFLMAKNDPSTGLCFKRFFAYVPSQQRFFDPLPGLEDPRVASYLGLGAVCMASNSGLPEYGASALGFCMAGGAGLLCSVVNTFRKPKDKDLITYMDEYFRENSLHDHFMSAGVFDIDDYTVVVFNPITGAVHQLPQPFEFRLLCASHQVHVSIFPHISLHGHYYVVLLCSLYLCYDFMLIYNSENRSWKVAHALPTTIDQSEASCTLDSAAKGDLFFFNDRENRLFSYEVGRDLWHVLKTAYLPHAVDDGHMLLPGYSCSPVDDHETVLKCDGRIFFVRPRWVRGYGSGFHVCQLQEVVCEESNSRMLSWTLVSSTPDEILRITPRQSTSAPTCSFSTNGTLIIMSGYYSCGDYIIPLVFDLDDARWYHLPSYGKFDYVCLSYFQPSRHAKPLPSVSP